MSKIFSGILFLALFTYNLLPAQVICLPENPEGFAACNGGTTGGKGGDTVEVATRDELIMALGSKSPGIIYITDTIDLLFGERISVEEDNLSIIGKNPHAMLRYGGLSLKGNNLIIQNLSIGNSYTPGHWDGKGEPFTDAITVYGKNIWIDHCDLSYSHDGLLDFSDNKNECADFVTVSWTRFSNHNKVMLVGSNDKTTFCRDQFNITIHHCWFDGASSFSDSVAGAEYRIQQRMPRVRFGTVHVFNNYYEQAEDYCVAARIESSVVVERNFFRNLDDAHIIEDVGMGIKDPELRALGNYYENVRHTPETAGTAFNPSAYYEYFTDSAHQVPALVLNSAGRFNRAENISPVAVADTVIISSEKVNVFPLVNDSDADRDSIRISYVIPVPGIECMTYPGKVELTVADIAGLPEPAILVYEIIDFQGGMDTGFIIVKKE